MNCSIWFSGDMQARAQVLDVLHKKTQVMQSLVFASNPKGGDVNQFPKTKALKSSTVNCNVPRLA